MAATICRVLPQAQVQANPFTAIAATRKGGHLAFLQGWWPLGASYCDAVIDDWFAAALAEWRHGLDGILAVADGRSSSAAAAAASSSTMFTGQSQSSTTIPELSPYTLPSWVERARHMGWQQQQVDPLTLAEVLCSCHPELDPIAQAHATDAVLNAAAAPATVAAAAAGTVAEGAAKAAGNARYSWRFGFGSRASSSSSTNGLRGDGAWAPFDRLDSEGPGCLYSSSSSSSTAAGFTRVAADTAAVSPASIEASLAGAAALGNADSNDGYIGRQEAAGRPWQRRLRSRL